MSIKLEIPDYNTAALRAFGAALTTMAEELEGGAQVACDCVPKEAPPLSGFNLVVDPTVPPNTVEFQQAGATVGTIQNVAPTEIYHPLPVIKAGALDSDGIPWDNRIHAAAKTQCKDGTWKLRPGVDKSIVDQVRAELKGVQSIPTPTPQEIPAPVNPASPLLPAESPTVNELDVPPAPPVSLIAPPPAPEPVVAAPPATGPQPPANFAEMLKWVGDLITAGKITADGVNAACASHGLPKFNLLAGRPDLIPAVWSTVCLTVG